MKYELVYRARIAKPHFGFGGMDVHVDRSGIDLEIQHVRRMPLMVQDIFVSLSDRVCKQAIAHVTTVHERVLRIALRARLLR